MKPRQDVRRQLRVVGPTFDQLKRSLGEVLQPAKELKGQKLTKQPSHADVRHEIPTPPNSAWVPLVIANFGTIQRQLHEPGKAQDLLLLDLPAQDCRNLSH